MTNCVEAKNEVQQRTKKSSHFQTINCGEAKPKCSNATKNLVILKKQTVDNGTEVQQRTKKSSHFQMINCGQPKPKCSNAPKKLVILKKQTVDKRIRSAATHQKI